MLDAIGARFRTEFGGAPFRRFFAPGRINLLGAHLDYNGGDVLPMAVDRGIYLAIRARDDGRLRLRSVDPPQAIDIAGADGGERHGDEQGRRAKEHWHRRNRAVDAGAARYHGCQEP